MAWFLKKQPIFIFDHDNALFNQMQRISNLVIAFATLIFGLMLAFIALEMLLRLNPELPLRGMGVLVPIDAPIKEDSYDIYTSDADLFYWQADLMQPVAPEADRLEAQVDYFTDEFGFPNRPPTPSVVDIVILGRSYAMGAQSSQPWARQLMDLTGMQVLNLSQTGGGIDLKHEYFRRFGLPRKPRWVILEVLPSMDILGYAPHPAWMIHGISLPLIQNFAQRAVGTTSSSQPAHPVFPIIANLNDQDVMFTDFIYYLSALTVDHETLQASRNWEDFREDATELIQEAWQNAACVVLLYAPTKSEVYLPLIDESELFNPVLDHLQTWALDDRMQFVQTHAHLRSADQLVANAASARSLLASFAKETGVALIDPTEAMMQSILDQQQPYMIYDTHWSLTGNQLVAKAVADLIMHSTCP